MPELDLALARVVKFRGELRLKAALTAAGLAGQRLAQALASKDEAVVAAAVREVQWRRELLEALAPYVPLSREEE
jgi:hypothetical protein